MRNGKGWELFCLGVVDASIDTEDEEDEIESEETTDSRRESLGGDETRVEGVEVEVMMQLKKRRLELTSNIESISCWDGDSNMSPSLPLLLQFDQVLTQRLLSMHVQWLEKR
jgi:hypothetical protein